VNSKETLLAKLESEIKWQWHWERLNRHLLLTCIFGTWISNFIVLILAVFQVQIDDKHQKCVVLLIAALSALSVSLPILATGLRLQQRQEVYDRMARAYEFLRLRLSTDAIQFDDALAEFGRIHTKSTEKVIRGTP
jgi:hypothetical protein